VEELILPCLPHRVPSLEGRMPKVIGVDVAKDFIVAYDGKKFYVYSPCVKKVSLRKRLPKKAEVKLVSRIDEIATQGDVVVLEQTGSYGVRFAKLFQQVGAKVYIADGKALHRFRNGKRETKNDYVDAQAIREMYFSSRRKNVHPFHPQRYQLRTIIRHYQRLNKELTRAVNRLKQQLVHLFPEKDYHNLKRYKLFQKLDEIEKELLQHPESLGLVALSEVRNIKNIITSIDILKKELESIVKNHPDYEILRSFELGIIQMAVLIAYYWDISLFKDKNDFIAYCLMGVRYEQSGESVNSSRTDKSRNEIKGIFFMHFQRAHRSDSPFRPLVMYLRIKSSEYKKRYIKYLDKLFEWIFYALKYRLTFKKVIELSIVEKENQLQHLEKKIRDPQTKEDQYYYRRLLERYRNTSDLLLVCKDISTSLEEKAKMASEVECQDYYEELKNTNTEETGNENHSSNEGGSITQVSKGLTGIWRDFNPSTGGEMPIGIYEALKRRGFEEWP
jgi:transposase